MSRAVRGNTRKCIAVFIAVACGERAPLSPFIPRTPITRLLSNGLTWPRVLVGFLLVMRLIGCVRQHPALSHLVLCLQPFKACGHSAPFLSMTQNHYRTFETKRPHRFSSLARASRGVVLACSWVPLPASCFGAFACDACQRIQPTWPLVRCGACFVLSCCGGTKESIFCGPASSSHPLTSWPSCEHTQRSALAHTCTKRILLPCTAVVSCCSAHLLMHRLSGRRVAR
jgi:hypothetical protein